MARREPTVNLSPLGDQALIDLFGQVMAELRERGVVRSGNNPIADIAERLVADYYGGQLASPNERSYDVLASDGRRLQVKAMRMTQKGRTTLSALRSHDFDALVAVVFEPDMRVREAYEIPLATVQERQAWSSTWQAYRLSMSKALMTDPAITRISADELLATPR